MKKIALLGLMIISLKGFGQIDGSFFKLYKDRILKEYPCDIMPKYYYSEGNPYYLKTEELIKYFFKYEDSLYFQYEGFSQDIGGGEYIGTATKSVSLLFMIEYKNFRIVSYMKWAKYDDFDIMAYIYDNKNRIKDSLAIGVNSIYDWEEMRKTIFLKDDVFLRFTYGIDKNGKLETGQKVLSKFMELYKIDKKEMRFKKIKEMPFEGKRDDISENIPIYMKKLGLDYNKFYKKNNHRLDKKK